MTWTHARRACRTYNIYTILDILRTDALLSTRVFGLEVETLSIRLSFPSLLLHPCHKFVNNAGPCPILTPPPEILIRHSLLHKFPHLIPDIPAYPPYRLFCFQEFQPPIEPRCALSFPVQTLAARKEEAPILDSSVKCEGLLTWG